MSVPSAPTSLVKAIKDYFNIDSSNMVKEFKALSPQDKTELSDMLTAEGYNIERPTTTTTASA